MTAGRPAAILPRRAPAKSRGVSAASARRRTAAALTACLACATSAALTARIFSRMSATRELLSEFDEGIELGARRAALKQLERPLHSVFERRSPPADIDRRARDQGNDVARGPAGVLERGDDDLARFFHCRNSQGLRVVDRQAESLRVNEIFGDLAVLQLADHRLAAHGYLVEPFEAVDGHAALRAEPLEHPDLDSHKVLVKNAHHLPLCASGIGQRTKDVEDGAHAELAPHRGG